MGFSKAILG